MARPSKSANAIYRFPGLHRTSNRWRLRIDHGHGEKNFWWPALPNATVCHHKQSPPVTLSGP
jgi:hypothetical protein